MIESRIEEAVFSVVGARWMKVALVLVKAADAMGRDLPNGNERYEMVSARVEALVKDRRLEARGNTKNWRASEVRLLETNPQT
jgi:hypothetical protein